MDLDNSFYDELNHSKPYGYTTNTKRLELEITLQTWKNKQPFARSFKTAWNYLRYMKQADPFKISNCAFCQRWKTARLCTQEQIDKIVAKKAVKKYYKWS